MKKYILVFLCSALIICLLFIFLPGLDTQISYALSELQNNKTNYSIVSFFVLIFDIVLPVPSSIVMYLNGYVLGALIGGTVSLSALSIGAIVGYFVGRATALGLNVKSDHHANAIFTRYGSFSILVTRGIPVLSESICILCGYYKVDLKQYVALNGIGYLPLCFTYAVCGSAGYDQRLFFISFGCSLLFSSIFWLSQRLLLPTHANVNRK